MSGPPVGAAPAVPTWCTRSCGGQDGSQQTAETRRLSMPPPAEDDEGLAQRIGAVEESQRPRAFLLIALLAVKDPAVW